MSYQVLVLDLDAVFLDALSQIDKCLPILGTVSPIGAVAAAHPGIFYYRTDTLALYFCTVANGTIGGTTWVPLNITLPTATTDQAGILRLATGAEVTAGTDDTTAISPATAAGKFAQAGNNSNITQLNSLSTPLSRAQGGTGISANIADRSLLLGAGNNNWQQAPWFGAGPDGGEITNPSTTLSYTSATRYVLAGTHAIALPAPTSVQNGFLFRFKCTGPSVLTFTSSGSNNVDGVTSYVVDTVAIEDAGGAHYPCVDIQLINGGWWRV